MKYVIVHCENSASHKMYPLGTILQEIFDEQKIALRHPVLGAYVNNVTADLNYAISNAVNVRFFDYTDPAGRRVYFRGLVFVMSKALQDLYHQAFLTVEHAVPYGYYCSIRSLPVALDEKFVNLLQNRMLEIIRADLPFITQPFPTDEAIDLFLDNGLSEKARLFRSLNKAYTIVNKLDASANYFHGYLVPSTKCLEIFALDFYRDGILLRCPKSNAPAEIDIKSDCPKLFTIFREYKEWARLMQAKNIPDVNAHIEQDGASMLIKVSEALHEKKIAQIADEIAHRKGSVRFALVAGPSSSGKTTFSKRLAVQLSASGITPHTISLDDYFLNREQTPRDETGEYNFETIDALDLTLFNENLMALAEGKEVEIPKFDFKTGQRFYNGEKIKLRPPDVLIIEGIHGLNPKLTTQIAPEMKYLIFISAMTQISIDRHDYLSTSDNRLIRRIVRDNRYRGYSALETLRRWPSVRAGEEKYIFPYQENADVMFNSALIYEFGALKSFADPLLQEVPENEYDYNDAQRLLRILSYFKEIPYNSIYGIPHTSILREFLTGSSFKY